ncbi:MAG: TetR/AcrR family transcriptional regulator [Paracoccaceae bacterium]
MTDEMPPRPEARTDTRQSLIDAGYDLLREGGADALTLRRAAARAGVSHAAPAHHFNGLAGLQTAIAARAMNDFADTMKRRRAAADPDPFAQLLAICEGYLDFARSHAGLFHVMFQCPDIDPMDPAFAAAAHEAYGVLRAGCAPFASAHTALALETAVWSMVHGYTALRHGDPDFPAADGQFAPPFATVLALLLGNVPSPLAPPGSEC